MPPKKRARTTKVASATTRESLNEVQQALDQWIGDLYGMRHQAKADVSSSSLRPWPVEHGGTFQEVAVRAWEKPSDLVDQTAHLCYRMGLLDNKNQFEAIFCKLNASRLGLALSFLCCFIYLNYLPRNSARLVSQPNIVSQVWPPMPGEIVETSILQWSMKPESFWRSFLGMSEVVAIARSIAVSRFREAGSKTSRVLRRAFK